MGAVNTFVSRLPVVLIALGVLVITGTFRGREAASTSPTLGAVLVLAGVLVWGVLTVRGD